MCIRLAIITFENPTVNRTLRLFSKAAPSFGLEVSFLNPVQSPITDWYDLVWFRAGEPDSSEEALKLYSQFPKKMHVDPTHGLRICNDKLLQSELCREHSILAPATSLFSLKEIQSDDTPPYSFPFLIKSRFGYGGHEVFKVRNPAELMVLSQRHTDDGTGYICQEFLEMETPHDIRVFCVGGVVVRSCSRLARPGEFRSNISQGATVEPIEIPNTLRDTALGIAKLFQMNVVTIDFIPFEGNFYFIEANDSFSFEYNEEVVSAVLSYFRSRFTR